MAEEGGELNLIPYLDIVTNVIMFMLATTTFAAALGDINVSSPTTGAAAPAADDQPPPEPKNDLNLTVSISDKGFTIAASGAVLYQGFSFDAAGNLTQPPGNVLPTIPKKGDRLRLRRSWRAQDGADQELTDGGGRDQGHRQRQPRHHLRGHRRRCSTPAAASCIAKPDPDHPGKMLESYERFGDVLLSAGVN